MGEKILIKTLPYDEVKFRWVSNHYDIHLNGTCIYDDELCEFRGEYPDYNEETDDWEEIFVKIYKLNFINKLKWYWRQWKFEKCVGYHWSYGRDSKRGKSFDYRNPKWLYKFLFNLYYRKRSK